MTRLEFGLEHLGADLMEDVPDLEFGLAENLGVGLGREQAGHLEDVLFHRLEDPCLDLVTANYSSYSSSASVLLGNGDGTFGARVDYAVHVVRIGAVCPVGRDAAKQVDSHKSAARGSVQIRVRVGILRSGVTLGISGTHTLVATAEGSA